MICFLLAQNISNYKETLTRMGCGKDTQDSRVERIQTRPYRTVSSRPSAPPFFSVPFFEKYGHACSILWKESTRPEGRKNPLPTTAAQEVVTTHVMAMSMHCSLVLECLWSHAARTPRLIVLPSSFSAMVNQQACEINEIVFLRMEIQHKTSRSSHRRTEIQHKTYPGQNLSPGHVDLI